MSQSQPQNKEQKHISKWETEGKSKCQSVPLSAAFRKPDLGPCPCCKCHIFVVVVLELYAPDTALLKPQISHLYSYELY